MGTVTHTVFLFKNPKLKTTLLFNCTLRASEFGPREKGLVHYNLLTKKSMETMCVCVFFPTISKISYDMEPFGLLKSYSFFSLQLPCHVHRGNCQTFNPDPGVLIRTQGTDPLM